jgi:hypothetical protein
MSPPNFHSIRDWAEYIQKDTFERILDNAPERFDDGA